MQLVDIGESVKDSIIEHTKKEYPKEMCGVIVNNGGVDTFLPIPNIAHKYGIDEKDSFVIDPMVYSSLEDRFEIKAIVHSHPDANSTPSVHDRVRCNQGEIPWVIVSYPNIDLSLTHPNKSPDLEGREFVHGVQDCYTLIKDFYATKGITLGEYVREDEWWQKDKDYYLDNYGKEGFYEIEEKDLQAGDLILMQIESPKTNHAAILVSDNIILHHLYGRPSCKGVYGGYWRDRTTRLLRHKLLRGEDE